MSFNSEPALLCFDIYYFQIDHTPFHSRKMYNDNMELKTNKCPKEKKQKNLNTKKYILNSCTY